MTNKLATCISYLFHPILMPTYYLCWNCYYYKGAEFVLFFNWGQLPKLMLFSIVAPMLLIATLRGLKLVTSLTLPTARERSLPYLAMCAIYIACHYWRVHTYWMPLGILLVGAVCTLLLFVANHFSKVSAHMAGFTGLIGTILHNAYYARVAPIYELTILFALLGLVGYARMKLNAHSLAQVAWGTIVGLISVIISAPFI